MKDVTGGREKKGKRIRSEPMKDVIERKERKKISVMSEAWKEKRKLEKERMQKQNWKEIKTENW